MKSAHTKVLSLNILFFALLLALIELFIGDWKNLVTRRNPPATIPGLIKDKTIHYDARNLYGSSNPVKISYTRDKDGYRGKDKNSRKKIILTIGGSTTDQRYITDGETWQDYLDKEFPSYDFINGGVDGQSTYGHLASINSWHSTSLNQEMVSMIIFYLGVNDPRLLEDDLNAYDKPQNISSFIKGFLSTYSFFYPRLLNIYKSTSRMFKTNEERKKVSLAMHGRTSSNFLSPNDGKKFSGDFSINYSNYKQIFFELITQTRNNFPRAKIILVQQQAPGCIFKSKYYGTDIHPNRDSTGTICNKLATIYATQDEALKTLPSTEKVVVLPMYLKNILGPEDVYDFIHTNPSGSKKIGSYIQASGAISN